MFSKHSNSIGLAALLALAGLLMIPRGLQADEAPGNVAAIIKFPPLIKLSEKISTLAPQLTSQQEFMLLQMLVLAPMGYPNFPGVSPSAPVTIVVFEPEGLEPAPYVVMGKMTSSSPLRRMLAAQSGGSAVALGMSIQDRDDWTFVAKDPAVFDRIGNVSALADAVGDADDFDVTIRLYMGPERAAAWASNLKRRLREEGDQKDPAIAEQKSRYVEFFQSISQNVEFVDFGLSLNPSEVNLGLAAKMREGTPEFELLSAKAGGATPAAEFISAAAAVIYATNFDIAAVAEYYEVLNERAISLATPEGQALLEQAAAVNREMLAMLGNDSAGSTRIRGEQALNRSVASGRMTNQKIIECLNVYMEDILPGVSSHWTFLDPTGRDFAGFLIRDEAAQALFDQVAPAPATGVNPLDVPLRDRAGMVFNADVAQAAGVSINEIRSEVAPLAAATGEPGVEKSFFAVVDGNLVSANDQPTLESLIKSVARGEPVPDNVASKITLADGEALALRVNFERMIDHFLSGDSFQSQTAKQALIALKSEPLEPAVGKVTVGDGRAKGSLAIPVSSLVKISQARRQIEQSELEAQTFGPSGNSPSN